MSGIEIGAALFCSMLALMALRVPIAVAMFLPGAIGYLLLASPAALFSQLKGIAFARYSNYDLSVIPMFLLMGEFATHGGLSRALFRFGNTLLGHWRGGMAMASMIASAIFGGPCGSSVATTATVAQVALPELRRHHYSGRFATGTVAAGGVLGILIPPSVVLVVFAILAEQNIAKLFAASLIPSLIATVGYLVVIAVYARLHPEEAPLQTRQSRRAFFAALLDVSPMLAIFAVMLGGIYLGVFTPTEGGAVGAASTLLVALATRQLSWDRFKRCVYGTAVTTGMLFFIFIGADILNSALALSQLPAQLAAAVIAGGWSPLTVMACILLLYVLLGCVMDEMAMMLLTLPTLLPVVQSLDFFGLPPDAKIIWFGVLILSVVGVGLIAPPVGLNVYVVNNLARDVPMHETYRGVMPFLVADAIRIVLLVAFPALSLWLVQFVR